MTGGSEGGRTGGRAGGRTYVPGGQEHVNSFSLEGIENELVLVAKVTVSGAVGCPEHRPLLREDEEVDCEGREGGREGGGDDEVGGCFGGGGVDVWVSE